MRIAYSSRYNYDHSRKNELDTSLSIWQLAATLMCAREAEHNADNLHSNCIVARNMESGKVGS